MMNGLFYYEFHGFVCFSTDFTDLHGFLRAIYVKLFLQKLH
jgi:hypothetical protein